MWVFTLLWRTPLLKLIFPKPSLNHYQYRILSLLWGFSEVYGMYWQHQAPNSQLTNGDSLSRAACIRIMHFSRSNLYSAYSFNRCVSLNNKVHFHLKFFVTYHLAFFLDATAQHKFPKNPRNSWVFNFALHWAPFLIWYTQIGYPDSMFTVGDTDKNQTSLN